MYYKSIIYILIYISFLTVYLYQTAAYIKQCPLCDSRYNSLCKKATPASRDMEIYLIQRSYDRATPHSCIPLEWKCDGDIDCPEKDDEEGCLENACLKEKISKKKITDVFLMQW